MSFDVNGIVQPTGTQSIKIDFADAQYLLYAVAKQTQFLSRVDPSCVRLDAFGDALSIRVEV